MYDLTLNAANAIPFVLVDSLNVEVPGLGAAFTVLVKKNGGDFAASTGSKAELSGGWYLYTAPAGECDTPGPLPLRITAAGCAQQNLVYNVGNQDAQLAAIRARTDTIGALSVTITAPIARGGHITLGCGDDYLNTDGRALTFTGTNWPVLTGGSVHLLIGSYIYDGVVTGANTCYVELTDTQTGAILPGSYTYDLLATLSNDSKISLWRGTLKMQSNP